jgi:cation/acetate symporter
VIKAAPGGVNSAAPLLAFRSAVRSCSASSRRSRSRRSSRSWRAHDHGGGVVRARHLRQRREEGNVPADGEVKVARRTVIVIGILAILGGIAVQGQNIAFLVALAFAVAASANLPTIIYSLYWRKFTTRGAVWSMYGASPRRSS